MTLTNKLSDDAKALARSFSSADLRAIAEESERLEKASAAMTDLGFEVARMLGIEQAEKGDPTGKKWAKKVLSEVNNLAAGSHRFQDVVDAESGTRPRPIGLTPDQRSPLQGPAHGHTK